MQKTSYLNNDIFLPKNAWDSLSIQEKAAIMQVAIKNGIMDLPVIRQKYNEFAEGGHTIHIKPENRGKFTALKKRTGHSATWFKEHGTPAQKKMAVFALNARHWKHGDGGPLINQTPRDLYEDGGWLDNLKQTVKTFLSKLSPTVEKKELLYRNRPAEVINEKIVPKRINRNNSPTQNKSEKQEDDMRNCIKVEQESVGSSNPKYDIPFIPDKTILINGSTTSTNALDSLAKYAGLHNRNPQLSQYPIKRKSSYNTPRQINKNEMLGLAAQETHIGAIPYYNMNGNKEHDRILGNSNYFTAFGYIPAEHLVRNFNYNKSQVDKSTPPLLDAFRYFAQGDYNRGNPNHTKDVNAAGMEVWKNPAVRKWWDLSGRYWYNTGKGPK